MYVIKREAQIMIDALGKADVSRRKVRARLQTFLRK